MFPTDYNHDIHNAATESKRTVTPILPKTLAQAADLLVAEMSTRYQAGERRVCGSVTINLDEIEGLSFNPSVQANKRQDEFAARRELEESLTDELRPLLHKRVAGGKVVWLTIKGICELSDNTCTFYTDLIVKQPATVQAE